MLWTIQTYRVECSRICCLFHMQKCSKLETSLSYCILCSGLRRSYQAFLYSLFSVCCTSIIFNFKTRVNFTEKTTLEQVDYLANPPLANSLLEPMQIYLFCWCADEEINLFIDSRINYTSFVESAFIGVSVSGLLWLRYKQPNAVRPIKVSVKDLNGLRQHQMVLVKINKE